jgi:hypothetical protein
MPKPVNEKNFSEGIIFLDICAPLLLNVGILLTFNHLFEKGG